VSQIRHLAVGQGLVQEQLACLKTTDKINVIPKYLLLLKAMCRSLLRRQRC